ncbi:MAG: acyltransferase family protein [bacterium]
MRSPELDGVRGIAILLVVIFHYFSNPINVQPGTVLAYVQHAGYLGWTGVDLFFVLSGYLIGGILMDNRGATNYYSVFYLRRACRILPVYLLMVSLFYLLLVLDPGGLAGLYAGGTDLWHYVLFMQNYFVDEMGGYGPIMLSVTWSLAIEEQFYIVIPILIRVVSPRVLLVIILIIFFVAPIARDYFSNMGSITYALSRGDSLMTGVIIAWVQRYKPEIFKNLKIGSVLMLAVTSVMMLKLATGWPKNGGVSEHLVFSVFYGSFLLTVLQFQGTIFTFPLRAWALQWLGRRSYAIYLFHMPLIFVLSRAYGRTPGIDSYSDFVLPLVVFGICCVAAEFSYRAIERPFITRGGQHAYL